MLAGEAPDPDPCTAWAERSLNAVFLPSPEKPRGEGGRKRRRNIDDKNFRNPRVLTCKSFVVRGYGGEGLIEPSSSWFLPKFPSG